MQHCRSLTRTFTRALLATFALSLFAAASASAAGDATVELGDGGKVKGDISSAAGETDRIGIDLLAGETVDLKLRSAFAANVVLNDPSGAPVEIPFTDGSRTLSAKAWTAPTGGRYEFIIRSFDGTQGIYTLMVKPIWPRTIRVDPAGQRSIDVVMPANSRLKARFAGTGVTLNQLIAPDQSVLLLGVMGSGKGLVVPKTDCALAGTYRLDVSAAAGTFTGSVTRLIAHTPMRTFKITNGLEQLSYAKDGIATYFDRFCANCHGWAGSYGGVRGYASSSLARMRTGNMPQGGAKASAETLALVNAWIQTGFGR